MQPSKQVYPIERIISALTYITAGGAGFIWLLVATILKKQITQFLLYHIFQSIFLSMLYFIITALFKLIIAIPLINIIPIYIAQILNHPLGIFMGLSIIQIFTTSVMFYLAVTSFCGLYSYIPWVSDIINQNTGRR